MTRSSKESRKHKINQFLPQGASRSLLAVFFTFFFVFAQASDFANGNAEILSPESSSSVEGAELANAHHERHHLPIGSLPVPQESESKDERENTHESDDNSDKIFASLSLKERVDVNSDKCLLLRLLHARHNRKEVSLFVLHHSWKSFVS